MGKKYMFAGILISVFLHTAFFTMPNMLGGKKIAIPKGIPEEICTIEARIPEEPIKKEIKKAPVKEPEKKIENMKEVFKPDSVEIDAAPEEEGNIKIEEPTDEYMPALRMDISDRETIMGAVKYFGMKIALQNKMDNFVDEVSVKWFNKIIPIQEGLSEYSNRIRRLPENYFGEKLEKIIRMRKLKPCILVPAETDRKFAETQRQVIEKHGYRLDEVQSMTGKFVRGSKGYSLEIEKLYLNSGREDFL